MNRWIDACIDECHKLSILPNSLYHFTNYRLITHVHTLIGTLQNQGYRTNNNQF